MVARQRHRPATALIGVDDGDPLLGDATRCAAFPFRVGCVPILTARRRRHVPQLTGRWQLALPAPAMTDRSVLGRRDGGRARRHVSRAVGWTWLPGSSRRTPAPLMQEAVALGEAEDAEHDDRAAEQLGR